MSDYEARFYEVLSENESLKFDLAECEALEVSHGERIAKLMSERDRLRAALELMKRDKWHWEQIRDEALKGQHKNTTENSISDAEWCGLRGYD